MDQISLFSAFPGVGDWVETHGRELTFDEIAAREGQCIVYDMSTQSHAWYKIVRVKEIIRHEGQRRLIYSDGGRYPGLVNEMYFSPEFGERRARAYEISESEAMDHGQL